MFGSDYDKLINRALAGEVLAEDEWKFLIDKGKVVGRIEHESRERYKWVEVVLKWQEGYYAIGYEEGLVKFQKNEYWGSSIRKVRPVKRMIETIEWLGEYEEIPWKPEHGDYYYYPCVGRDIGVSVVSRWNSNSVFDLAMNALGMCYHNYEEAELHFAEDYKKLTGKDFTTDKD